MKRGRGLKFAATALMGLLLLVIFSIVGASPAVPQTVNWPTGAESFYINPPVQYVKYLTYGLNSLWLTDPDEGKIWRINPTTGEVQGSIDSGYGGGIAFDGQYLWRAAYGSPVIQKLRVSDGAVVHQISSVGDEQAGLAWDGEHLWVVTRSTGRIYELDPSSGSQLRSFELPGANPRGLTWWNGYLYHSDNHQDTIYQLDPDTGAIVSKITTPTRSSVPRGLAFDGSQFWYSDWYEGIRQLVSEVSPDERIIRSNPSLMMAEMTYSITNTGGAPIENPQAYWAVPKSDDEHEILELTFDPPPDEYVYDMFERKIAHFYFPPLAPGDTEQIILSAYEKIWRVNYRVDPGQAEPLENIPQEIRDLYLVDDDALHITHPDIIAAALEAVDGETNAYLMAIKIHDYVAQHIVYEYPHDVPWDAVSVLHEGRGDCSRYALLFMALGRAVGLPTREVTSFYYYKNEDRPSTHVWAEAYIPGYGWIPFDPTRDDTDPLRDRYVGCEPLGIVFPENGGTDDRYLGWGSRSWRTGGMPSTRDSTTSGWPPLRISDFSTTPGDAPSSIRLMWSNPLAPDLDEVLVKRKTGRYPASRKDGTTVYWDGSPVPQEAVIYEDTGLSPGVVYYYAVFTKSATGIWRSVVEEGVKAAYTTPFSSETAAVFRVTREGDVFADRAYYGANFYSGTGADIAEYIELSEAVEPGDVVELDPDRPSYYRKSREPYSTLVAGVVSTTPGITLGAQVATERETRSTLLPSAFGLALDNLSISRIAEFSPGTSLMLSRDFALDKPQLIKLSLDPTIQQLWPLVGEVQRPLLALMGVVPVKATAENGPIKPGDLLTTSSTPGYAMRCAIPQKCEGAIIGKALESLEEGMGLIKMLVMR